MDAVVEAQHRSSAPPTLNLILAFFAIYVIWGSTYLAIRVAVATVPPFLAAGMRFTAAGLILLIYASVRKLPMPSAREWRNLSISALMLFVPSYGGLFWAEKTVPSGIASAVVATIPVWMALMEVFVLRQTKLRWQMIASTILGFGGVSILAIRGVSAGSHSLLPYLVMLVSQITWCIGTLLTKNMQLPKSKPLVAGAQMALGRIDAACNLRRCGRTVSVPLRIYGSRTCDPLSHYCRIGYRFHCVPVSAWSFAGDDRRQLRIRQSGCGAGTRLLAGA